MDNYEVLKDCWINRIFYKKSQILKLSKADAKEWLDRKCIKVQVLKSKKEEKAE